MAIIKSGATSDQLTIDPTSKAARVTLYDTLGNNRGEKRTYRAASAAFSLVVATVDLPFFIIEGSATTVLRVQRINVAGVTSATLGVDRINCRKYSTAASGGTPVNLTQVPLDSNSAAGTANRVSVYTAGPTAGTLVGNISSKAVLAKSTTIAEGAAFIDLLFDFRALEETEPVVLRGTSQGLGLCFSTAAAASANLQVEVEWTEE